MITELKIWKFVKSWLFEIKKTWECILWKVDFEFSVFITNVQS